MKNERPSRQSSSSSRTQQGSRQQTTRESTAGMPARRIALEVIRAVRADDAYANLLLPGKITEAKLSPADAAFTTELCYGTLRMRGYYDRVIEITAGRELSSIDPAVLDVLELGTHQLLAMRVPSHAAVNDSVELTREIASRSATGFVNGILRTISRATPEHWHEQVLANTTTHDEALAAQHSHPEWVVRALRRSIAADLLNSGTERERLVGSRSSASPEIESELESTLRANNAAPRTTLVALPGFAQRPDDDTSASLGLISPLGFVAPAGDPASYPGVANGFVRVQDEGSQVAALALSRAREIRQGEQWLDLCAGPGGKAALLAAEAMNAGATLTANEPIAARAGLVRNALSPLAGEANSPTVWERDGRSIGENHPEQFDRILVDAPCTGLGALRRRPEARWRKKPSDVSELVSLQSALLDSALLALKPGGLLAYVTCSPHLAETRGQIARLIENSRGALTLLNTAQTVESLDDSTAHSDQSNNSAEGSTVQLWPHRNNTDAMFIALMQKSN